MAIYISSIKSAVYAFPFVALLITLPYAIKLYRSYGSIPKLHTFTVYTIILYLMCAYFLVILPLPDPSEVALHPRPPQLVPGAAIHAIIAKSGFVLNNTATWIPALKSFVVLQVVFNIALTVPFGFYLRYFFHRKWWQAAILGFCLSLFFELTQLTGLYGIYPAPYRLFDVDDLICNTIGTLLGFALAIPLMKVLPSIDKSRDVARDHAGSASVFRRLIGTSVDMIVALGVVFAIEIVVPHITRDIPPLGLIAIGIVVSCVFVPLFAHGRTIGQHLVRIQVVKEDGTSAPVWRCVLRNVLLYFVIFAMPLYALALGDAFLTSERSKEMFASVFIMLAFVLCAVLVIRALVSLRTHSFVMLQGLLTGTRIDGYTREEEAADHARWVYRADEPKSSETQPSVTTHEKETDSLQPRE